MKIKSDSIKDIGEKRILDYFMQVYSDFPKGKLKKSESPDFILQISKKQTIGIELTRLADETYSIKERIENTLFKKREKYIRYQSKMFTAIWLIIHAEHMKESKSFNMRNKMNKWEFHFEFDKVFIFDLYDKKIFDLIKP